jgi:hypothetical protein
MGRRQVRGEFEQFVADTTDSLLRTAYLVAWDHPVADALGELAPPSALGSQAQPPMARSPGPCSTSLEDLLTSCYECSKLQLR